MENRLKANDMKIISEILTVNQEIDRVENSDQ